MLYSAINAIIRDLLRKPTTVNMRGHLFRTGESYTLFFTRENILKFKAVIIKFKAVIINPFHNGPDGAPGKG